MTEKEKVVQHFILEKSEALFVQHGYQSTSMDMIANECGISKPTVYKYFSSKSELFINLSMMIQQEIYRLIEKLMNSGRNKHSIIADIVDLAFKETTRRMGFFRMMVREHHQLIHPNIDDHLQFYLHSKNDIIEKLSKCIADIVVPGIKKKFGVNIVAASFYNLLNGFLMDLVMAQENKTEASKDFILTFLKQGVLLKEV